MTLHAYESVFYTYEIKKIDLKCAKFSSFDIMWSPLHTHTNAFAWASLINAHYSITKGTITFIRSPLLLAVRSFPLFHRHEQHCN